MCTNTYLFNNSLFQALPFSSNMNVHRVELFHLSNSTSSHAPQVFLQQEGVPSRWHNAQPQETLHCSKNNREYVSKSQDKLF